MQWRFTHISHGIYIRTCFDQYIYRVSILPPHHYVKWCVSVTISAVDRYRSLPKLRREDDVRSRREDIL